MKKYISFILIVALLTFVNPMTSFAAKPFSFSQSITVQTGKVPTTQTNFAMVVYGTFDGTSGTPDLRTTANGGKVKNASGFDIGFYSDAACGTKLSWETEVYTATTGVAQYWVNVPSISDGTVIYICYGNSDITTDQSNKAGVWDSSYKAVMHLPNGSALASPTLDSTSNANNGVLTNAPTATAGKIDGGANLASTSSQHIDLGTSATLNPTAITIEAWVYIPTFATNGYGVVLSKIQSGAGFYQFFIKNDRKMAIYIQGSPSSVSYDSSGSQTITAATWTHVAATYDSSSGLTGYINAVQDANVAASGAMMTTNSGNAEISNDTNTAGRFLNGIVDEVKVSNIARTQNWITTEYNNQSAPSSFYAFGTAAQSNPSGGKFILEKAKFILEKGKLIF